MAQRKELQEIGNYERHTFVGSFQRAGFKTYRNLKVGKTAYTPTLVLNNIRIADGQMNLFDINTKTTQHLWFNYGKNFLKLGELHPGDKIQFDARISQYEKNYRGKKVLDYQLERPTKIKKLDGSFNGNMPIGNNNALVGYIMNKNKKQFLKNHKPNSRHNPFLIAYRKWRKTVIKG